MKNSRFAIITAVMSLILLNIGIKLPPLDAEQLCARAGRAYDAGKKAGAEKLYRDICEHYPDRTDAHIGLAVCQMDRHCLHDAVVTLREVFIREPCNIKALNVLKECLQRQGKLEEIKPILEGILGNYPDNIAVRELLVDCLSEQGSSETEYHKELLACKKKCAEKPDQADGYIEQAFFYYRNGHSDKVTDLLRTAFTLEPENIDALILAGVYSKGQKQLAEAESYLRKAFEQDPENEMIQGILGACLLGQGKVEEAAPYISFACQQNPQEPYYLYHYAELLSRHKKNELAKHFASQAIIYNEGAQYGLSKDEPLFNAAQSLLLNLGVRKVKTGNNRFLELVCSP
ncbi:MAG: tetratricopeptide repeat protein [Alphaproteobacteria bacterium]|nr:tetratricopeptide repeat protein [Alphaproteobacteria bacterium]